MAISIKHKFTSPKADGPDATLVQPSNWNEEHDITLASYRLLGRGQSSAGAVEEVPFTAYTKGLLAAANSAAALATLGAAAASDLTGLQRVQVGSQATLTGKTAGGGGKLWDVPSGTRRILFRIISVVQGAGENWGFRLYSPADGLVTSGYNGGHARLPSGAANSVSTSPSFWVIGGSVSASDTFTGDAEMFRANSHSWTLRAQLFEVGSGAMMRFASGSRFGSNEITEIHLHGSGTFTGGAIVPVFFIDA